MDTHHSLQIFHALFLVDQDGEHPAPNTMVSHRDVLDGRWQVNPAAARAVGLEPEEANDYLAYYTGQLAEKDRFELTVWPYHAMLGGIGHALVSGVEEAVFFHSQVRQTYPDYHLKGQQIQTEAYSAVGPEIEQDQHGRTLKQKSTFLIDLVQRSRSVFIAGQAQSHCVAWTINDLAEQIQAEDPGLAEKVYLLEDCTSPVVIPEVVDYTEEAEAAFQRFKKAGMKVVTSERIIPNLLDS
jgi:nicotinamidase-related amidase